MTRWYAGLCVALAAACTTSTDQALSPEETEVSRRDLGIPKLPPSLLSGRIAFQAYPDRAIITMRPDGTDRHRLPEGFRPRWAPDGNKIAFWRMDDGRPGVYVMNADGSDVKRLHDGYQPSWSADGQRLVFGCGGVCAMNADGTGFREVVHFDVPTLTRDVCIRASEPTWTPDGTTIAFTTWPANRPTHFPENVDCVSLSVTREFPLDLPSWLMMVSETGGEPRMPSAAIGSSVTWSPDGTRVAAFSLDGQGGQLKRVLVVGRSDGQGPVTQISVGDSQSLSAPEWSPDGAHILVAVRDRMYFVDANGINPPIVSPENAIPGAAGNSWEGTGLWSWSRR